MVSRGFDPNVSPDMPSALQHNTPSQLPAGALQTALACIHELFEEQAVRTPEHTALVTKTERQSFEELNRRANQLAHHLRRLGVGPETLVGICMERSAELIVALLGVHKAGGAYVPLDPDYPRERLACILEDARVPVLITQSGLKGILPDLKAEVIDLDTRRTGLSRESAANLPNLTRPENLSHVIYTSGSTGRPKGVGIEHRNVNAFLHWAKSVYPPEELKGMLASTSVCFDLSVFEIFTPLCWGGTIYLADNALELPSLPEAHNITLVNTVPSAIAELLRLDGIPTSVRVVNLAGEALSCEIVDRLYQKPHIQKVYDLYGPTEDTVYSTFSLRRAGEPATIGRPLAGKHVYLLDEKLKRMPTGEHGEIYIGGHGLARGYLDRPELTAEKFVADPFGGEPGARLYRTGDLARWRADGNLEFLGRIDHQVKIRGYRIELGEIESVLRKHPQVSDCVVVAREDAPGDKRLVGYVVATPEFAGKNPDNRFIAQLRSFLKEKLPDYMIPSAFVIMDRFPRTPNGKLDRRALPEPVLERNAVETTYAAPRSETEMRLAEIWCALLGIQKVGIRDHFFELGGHSLLATRMIFEIREKLGVDLSLRTLMEKPTVDSLASEIDSRLQSRSRAAPLPKLEADPARRHEPFPLTDVQTAYWIGRSGAFELGNIGCRIYQEIDCDRLDLSRLERALQRLVDRHEMLRAVFLADGTQKILPEVPRFQIQIRDLRGLADVGRQAELDQARHDLSHRIQPSDQWPLFEVHASLLDERRTRLHFGIDFLIVDGLSMEIFLRDLHGFYVNPDLELAPPAVSYRDYVLAEASIRNSELCKPSIDYWEERIKTLPSAPDLPLAKNPAAIVAPRFNRRSANLDTQCWSQLKDLARRSSLTPSVILLAAFAEVVRFWSKAPRFTINMTLLNRFPLHPQVNDVIGDFTSLNMLEADPAAGSDFELRARGLQNRLSDDLDHRFVSGLQVLHRLSQLQGNRVSMPVVFNSMVNLDEASNWDTFGKVTYEISQTPQVWLENTVKEKSGALAVEWDSVDELFPSGLLDEMFGAYMKLLGRLSAEPACWKQKYFDFLSAVQVERRRRVNATQRPVPGGLLQTRFFEQARRHPEREAVISARRRICYGELARAARRLGRKLRGLGARPNTLVAVVMEKGWEQIPAVLGILGSGAAYLPVDAQLPRERLWHLLRHGEVKIALTQPAYASSLQWPEGIERIVVEESWLAAHDEAPLETIQSPEDIAYVIYTSGSTGLPKGVVIDHQGAINTIVDVNDRIGAGPNDRVLALSALNFDLSVYDIFGLLAIGGAIVVPEADANRDPERWLRWIQEEKITLWNTVPALMEMLVDYTAGENLPLPGSLRTVMMSGDWIPVNLPGKIRAQRPNARLISMGGATEASIWSIWYPIEEVGSGWKSIPYGKPMANQEFHVFTEDLRPRPDWVTGQLFIGGIGLAKGYWRDSEKTAGSFMTHPETGQRLYRTGDLGRFHPNGNIEFFGREDFQVKISGFRIELGEIESALARHPGIKEVVVIAREDRPGEKRLVAYLVPKETPGPSGADLSRHLGDQLPEYMVPSAFVTLEKLPLSLNGKVDRKALPEPDAARPELGARYATPRTPAERKLAEIWTELLGVKETGIHDNFFELGGDSILAIQIISRARQVGLQIAPRQFFQHQTIAELAAVATEVAATTTEQGLVSGTLPLIPIQHWFFEHGLDDAHHWNQSFLFELTEKPNTEWLKAAVRHVILHHDALRLRFSRTADDWRQEYGPPSEEDVPFNCINLAGVPECEQAAALTAAAAELQAALNLEKGPLLRAAYFDLGRGQAGRLLLAIHHLVVDGISWRVLLEDLELAYTQLRGGKPVQLPPKTTPFKVWAEKLAEHARSGALQAEIGYWLDRPAAALALLPPDTDPRGPNTEASTETVITTLTPEETADLLQKVPRVYNTQINDVLLTALLLAFQKNAGADSILVHLEGHGREELGNGIDVSRSVGWFTSLFPLHLKLEGSAGPGPMLKSVKEQLRRVPKKGIGYGLIRYLSGDAETARKLRALPQPGLAFNYLGQFDQLLAGASLFRFACESEGPWRSPRAERVHMLEVTALVLGGQLQLRWSFSAHQHRRLTIERVAQDYMSALREIIRHCLSPEAGGYTPSDFALAGLSQTDLDDLLSELG